MNCSSCGKPLGAVAHIYNEQLLCEDCYAKIGSPQANSPAHTVLIGQHDDDERARAAQMDPNENISTESVPEQAAGAPPPLKIAHPSLLLPGEQILWKRTFSKGIIHRHPTIIEVITNMRILVVDEVQRAIVRAVPISNATLVVTNTKRQYAGTRSGYGRSGFYSGVSGGSSTTYGDVEFVLQGSVVFALKNIRDPFGCKNLLTAAIRGAKK